MSDAQLVVVVTEDPQVTRSMYQVVDADPECRFEIHCCPLEEAVARLDESEVSAVFVDIDPGPSEMLGELQQSGTIRLLDLHDAFATGEKAQCTYFSDLLHASRSGMNLLTDHLTEILGE